MGRRGHYHMRSCTTDLGYGNKFSYSIKLEKTETIIHDHGAEFDKMWENYMAKF